MKLFAFSLVFAYAVFDIQIATIIYLIIFIKHYLFDKLTLTIKVDLSLLLFALFATWVTISTVIFRLETSSYDFRILSKYVFIFFYLIFIFPIRLNQNTFDILIYKFSLLFSLFIILLFSYLFIFQQDILLNGIITRLWAVGYIPGWPNSAPIPLLFGLWISFRNNLSLFGKLLLSTAIILTFARTGWVCASMIAIFYFYIKILKNIKNFKILSVCALVVSSIFILFNFESEVGEIFYYSDRLDVFHYALSYIERRPLLGYGGNTLDQLDGIYTGYIPLFPWNHTHNWILEMMLRYGLVGAFLFIFYMASIFIKIKNSEKRFMFFLLLFSALFQTYMQEFIYLFFLSYLASESSASNPNVS